MASKWRKAKQALGLNLCYHVPKTMVDDDDESPPMSERVSDAALLSRPITAAAAAAAASGRLSKSFSRKHSSEVCTLIFVFKQRCRRDLIRFSLFCTSSQYQPL